MHPIAIHFLPVSIPPTLGDLPRKALPYEIRTDTLAPILLLQQAESYIIVTVFLCGTMVLVVTLPLPCLQRYRQPIPCVCAIPGPMALNTIYLLRYLWVSTMNIP